MNSSERYQNGATISTWDKVSDNYEWDNYWKGYENKAHLHILLSYIGDPREKTIIEVGCGSGFLSIALALKGAQCSLLDISSKSLRIAIDGFTRFGLEEPDSYNEDALELSWKKCTPKSGKIPRRRCKDERDTARALHEGVSARGSKDGSGRRHGSAGGSAEVGITAIDVRQLGKGA